MKKDRGEDVRSAGGVGGRGQVVAHAPAPTQHAPVGPLGRVLALPFLAGIWVYRLTLSPFIGGACRFTPTCSRYAEAAYREHGPWLGTRLTIVRLLRCHPWSGRSGYDPVPVNEPPGRPGSGDSAACAGSAKPGRPAGAGDDPDQRESR